MSRDQIIARESCVRVIGPRDPREKDAVNCCSIAKGWSRQLSPFYLGPVTLWDGRVSCTMENAWQGSKVYSLHYLKSNQSPTAEWYDWSERLFNNPRAVRYPMGRGAKPVGSWWDGEILNYVTARKAIYWPLYRNAVRKMFGWECLKKLFTQQITPQPITLWDFDGYERGDKTLREVVNDPQHKMGHAFVLAAMLIYGRDVTPGELP